jgi:hypothetical protein
VFAFERFGALSTTRNAARLSFRRANRLSNVRAQTEILWRNRDHPKNRLWRVERSFVMLALTWREKRFYTAAMRLQERLCLSQFF